MFGYTEKNRAMTPATEPQTDSTAPANRPHDPRGREFKASYNTPFWQDFAAVCGVSRHYIRTRVLICLAISGGAVAALILTDNDMMTICLLGASVIAFLILEPTAFLGRYISKASRYIWASCVGACVAAYMSQRPEIIAAAALWTMCGGFLAIRANKSWLIAQNFKSAMLTPDAIHTHPDSRAARSWDLEGRAIVNGISAELGAACHDYAEAAARKVAYYAGYKAADSCIDDLQEELAEYEGIRRQLDRTKSALKSLQKEHKKLVTDYNSVVARNNEAIKLHVSLAESEARKEADALREEIAILKEEIEDLKKGPEKPESKDERLEKAFLELNMSDKQAGVYAGISESSARGWRNERGIPPKSEREREGTRTETQAKGAERT